MFASILKLFKRPPDFVIGEGDNPYLLRWWVIPMNQYFNIYLHNFRRSDDDRALHDHPWWNLSFLLKGSYIEVLPDGSRHKRVVGKVVLRSATDAHRLELIDGQPVWSLFLTGPRIRTWGFHCPQGWRVWYEFISLRDGGNAVGRGCD